MTTDDLIDYYASLLILQYATLARARGTVVAFVKQAIADQIISQVREGFNFSTVIGLQADTARGVQLNAIASYRGANRQYFGFAPNRQYFTTPDYSDPDAASALGFMEYGDDPDSIIWFFLTYEDATQPIYTLTDDELCRLTQFRARLHAGKLSVKEADDLLFDFFGLNATVLESGQMFLLYIDLTSDTDTLFTLASISKSLPRPAGVALVAMRADMLDHFFGVQDYDGAFDHSFAGFSDYDLGLQTGTFIGYP